MTYDDEVHYLMSFEMPEAEARAWATVCAAHEISLDIPPGWFQAGFTLSDATPWIETLGLTDERAAAYFSRAGWAPQEAVALLQVYLSQPEVAATRVIDVDRWLQAAAPWVDSGLPPERVCRYTAAGVPLEAAKAFEWRCDEGEDIEPVLSLLSALKEPHI